MAENEVVDYYDSIASQYDESRFGNSYGMFIDGQERKVLDRLIDVHQDSLRLEIACGTGRLTNYATHALDASNEMMKLAMERHHQVEFRCASATNTGYPDGMFDCVYAFHLFMHLNESVVSQIMDEAHRILKPNGRLIFDIPSKKRRRLLNHRQVSWHGGMEMDCSNVVEMIGNKFQLRRHYGIMMLPVHKLPDRMRLPLQQFDFWLANGLLKEYSSYLVFELKSSHIGTNLH
jgi:SAM-dependent methyltransferase